MHRKDRLYVSMKTEYRNKKTSKNEGIEREEKWRNMNF